MKIKQDQNQNSNKLQQVIVKSTEPAKTSLNFEKKIHNITPKFEEK